MKFYPNTFGGSNSMSDTSKNIIRTTLLLSTAVFGLSACAGVNPSSIPTGYTHHAKVYKSADPIQTPRITKKQRASMTAQQAEDFRNAVYNLVDELTLRAGLPPKPVYVAAVTPMTPFYSNIDNDLREALLNAGYVLSDTPRESYVFAYQAFILDAPVPVMTADGKKIEVSDYNNVRLALTVSTGLEKGAKKLTEEVADYKIIGAEDLYMPATLYEFLPYNDYVNWRPAKDEREPRTVRVYE